MGDLIADTMDLVSDLESAASRYERTARQQPRERDELRRQLAPHMADLCARSAAMLRLLEPVAQEADAYPSWRRPPA